MAGFSDASQSTGPTAGNLTQLVVDCDEYVSIEDAWGGARYREECGAIARSLGLSNSSVSRCLTSWLSGCITTEPLPPYFDYEKSTPDSHYIPNTVGSGFPGVLTATSVPVKTEPLYNAPTLTGLSTQPGTKQSGGNFFQRVIAVVEAIAGIAEGWYQNGSVLNAPASVPAFNAILTTPQTILATAPVLAAPVAPAQGLTQKMTPVAQADQYAPADQSFQISFLLPGSAFAGPDSMNTFFFGGVNGGCDFQYALHFRGNGIAELSEYAQSKAGQPYHWFPRFVFPYCRPGEVANRLHQIIIFPHQSPEAEKFISFRTQNHVPAVLISGQGGLEKGEFLYKRDPLTAGSIDGSPGHVTGAGRWHVQERADLRHQFQVRRTMWCPYGEMIDTTWELPLLVSDRPFQANTIVKLPAQDLYSPPPRFVLRLLDSKSNAVVTAAGQVTDGGVYADFQFFGSFDGALILWGYSLYLPPVSDLAHIGAITPPIEQAEVKGGEADPRRESGVVSLDDATGSYLRLATRGSFPVRMQVRIPTLSGGGGTTYANVVLARGYVNRPHGTKRGKPNRKAGLSGRGAATSYPSPDWGHYELTFAGMWQRLARVSTKSALTPKFFAFDPSATPTADAPLPGFKITDIIQYLIGRAGFPVAMINIPDLPIRIQSGIGVDMDDFVLDPHNSIADMIVTLARNYLGYVLIFDPNAGAMVMDVNGGTEGAPIGQWKLIPAGVVNATPIAHFVTDVSMASSGTTAVWHPSALPANTTYTIGDMEGWTDPPEGNRLIVLTQLNTGKSTRVKIENEAFNPYSYKAPGFTGIALDPNSPHYLGYEAPIFVYDASLWGGGSDNGLSQTQSMVDLTIRQIFRQACLPHRIQPVVSPLLRITDAETGRERPLRYGDPVTFNGENYYIRNVNPSVKNSAFQYMHCELERTIPMPA